MQSTTFQSSTSAYAINILEAPAFLPVGPVVGRPIACAADCPVPLRCPCQWLP